MSAHNLQFTPYQDINEFLNLFLSNIQVILGDRFISLYLGGSLALGDFNPLWSDIDFIAVTRDELPPDTIGILEKMHHQLWATGSKWAKKLDGSYVPAPILRNWTSDDPPCPFIEEDRFCITHQGSAVIQRHIIRQSGVVVAGSDPANLLILLIVTNCGMLCGKIWRNGGDHSSTIQLGYDKVRSNLLQFSPCVGPSIHWSTA